MIKSFIKASKQIVRFKTRVTCDIRNYAGGKANKLEQWATKLILKMLQRFGDRDTGSKELLTFGLQVVAKKES